MAKDPMVTNTTTGRVRVTMTFIMATEVTVREEGLVAIANTETEVKVITIATRGMVTVRGDRVALGNMKAITIEALMMRYCMLFIF